MKQKTTIILLVLAAHAQGASLLTLSNPVADNTINTAASNNDRSDWLTTIAFPTDADEANATDFQSITVAHDSSKFYIREQLYRTANSGFFAGSQILFFDTDQNSANGYTGPLGNYAIGAEFLLEGTSLYSFGGGVNQTAFSWNFIATVSYDDFPTNDHELSFASSLIGSPVSFDFIAVTDYYGGDLYSDTAMSGASGGYYTYSTVPEPGAALLGGLGFACLLSRRSKRH